MNGGKQIKIEGDMAETQCRFTWGKQQLGLLGVGWMFVEGEM